ncbi:hypothetical protein F8377_02580 [Corynebacterium zhongnanshanii]|uniref:Uncharacterized protein n=1 Tax=Corynebacterium zhongnanshanii TaxID=2768834 RepID=A0ABQ6VF75_9CORY|nr:hypothetical protein [Corynebacterium zhongnanshanii]KAB3523064.1 hypothetical protein F8377_02580 [Corynebacterium zhongnanshanii]
MNLSLLGAVAPFALIDSLNLLLFAFIFLLRVTHGDQRERFVGQASLVLCADYLGILAACGVILSLLHLSAIDPAVVLESAFFGLAFIALGLVALYGTWKGKSILAGARKLLGSFSRNIVALLGLGFLTGLIQSLTSLPFWGGIMYALGNEEELQAHYFSLAYSSLAISTPLVLFIAVAAMRPLPERVLQRHERTCNWAIAILLTLLGVMHL